jgi:hypothetical protein
VPLKRMPKRRADLFDDRSPRVGSSLEGIRSGDGTQAKWNKNEQKRILRRGNCWSELVGARSPPPIHLFGVVTRESAELVWAATFWADLALRDSGGESSAWPTTTVAVRHDRHQASVRPRWRSQFVPLLWLRGPKSRCILFKVVSLLRLSLLLLAPPLIACSAPDPDSRPLALGELYQGFENTSGSIAPPDNYYLKFIDDETVLNTGSAQSPDEVRGWFHRGHPDVNSEDYELSGNTVTINYNLASTYLGTIDGDRIFFNVTVQFGTPYIRNFVLVK